MHHPQLHIWNFIAENIENNIASILLYVVESTGSSPGRKGFAMVVNKNNELKGSIGGGIMEHKLVELAKQKLSINSNSIEIKKQIHNKEAAKNQSGMICSGEQTIVFIPIKRDDLVIVKKIIDSLQTNTNNTLQLSNSGIECIENHSTFDYVFNTDNYNNWIYKEKIGYKNTLTIIGAGHCALALSQLMSTMDFYIELLDDRNNLNTFLENNFVHHKQIISSYDDVKKYIQQQQNHYVVVMTIGYRTDAIAVKALENISFTYMGVLGSKHKMEQLLNEFEVQGVNKQWLQTIHTPIGINIKSKTPQEIAISIAAEIIKVKNLNS